MLDARVKIHVDSYKDTVMDLMPEVVSRISQSRSRKTAVRFLKDLNDELTGVVANVLERLDEETIHKMVGDVARNFGQSLTPLVNQTIGKNALLGGKVQVEGVNVRCVQSEEIVIDVPSILLHYRQLLDEPKVQDVIRKHAGIFSGLASIGAHLAAFFMPNTTERIIYEKVVTPDHIEMIKDEARKIFLRYGIRAEIEDITIGQRDGTRLEYPQQATSRQVAFPSQMLSEEYENVLIVAACGYLAKANRSIDLCKRYLPDSVIETECVKGLPETVCKIVGTDDV